MVLCLIVTVLLTVGHVLVVFHSSVFVNLLDPVWSQESHTPHDTESWKSNYIKIGRENLNSFYNFDVLKHADRHSGRCMCSLWRRLVKLYFSI